MSRRPSAPPGTMLIWLKASRPMLNRWFCTLGAGGHAAGGPHRPGGQLPVYIHFGQLWPLPYTGAQGVEPDAILPQVIELLKPGDVLAHPFTRHPGGFVDKHGRVHPLVHEALARGLRVDVGMAPILVSRWRGLRLMPGLCRIRLGRTCMAITPGCPDGGYSRDASG